jgi:aspartate/methionine/tyrosine aminotransferase
MMRVPRFAMERMQSTYENLVDYNLSESGVHPMRVEDLIGDPSDRAGVLGQELFYPQSNGTVELRERIAAMYPGATANHIEVTNGGSEANFVTMWHLIEPGDEIVSMVPNYGQTLGLAEGFGGVLRP